jgi:hypothetical protein
MNEVSGHLHRLSREEKQAKQRATHKQEEERIKLDDIVELVLVLKLYEIFTTRR